MFVDNENMVFVLKLLPTSIIFILLGKFVIEIKYTVCPESMEYR